MVKKQSEEDRIKKASEYIQESEKNSSELIDSLSEESSPSITQHGDGSTVILQSGDSSTASSSDKEQIDLLKKMFSEQQEFSELAIRKISDVLSKSFDILSNLSASIIDNENQKLEEVNSALRLVADVLKERTAENKKLKKILKENNIDI